MFQISSDDSSGVAQDGSKVSPENPPQTNMARLFEFLKIKKGNWNF